jgi:hypothetical protein
LPEVVVGPPFPDDEEGRIPAYGLDLPEARDAEEWHSVYRDLEFAIDVTNYLLRVMGQRESQGEGFRSVGTSGFLEKALYTAALIAYMRCFGTGKRKTKLDEGIFSGDAAHMLYRHRYWKDTRNKHLAHSVNAFDTTSSAAWIKGLDTEEPDIQQVGVIFTFRASDAIDDIRWLVKVATYAQTIAFGRMDRANKKLDERVRSLSKEKLKKLKRLTVYPPMGPEAAATPRD